MNETTSPQPTRRGFCGALSVIAAAIVWNPLKALRARAPAKAAPAARAFSAGAMRRDPCFWLGGNGEWNDPTKWLDGRIPRDGDSAIIPDGQVEATVEDDVRLDCLTLHKGASLDITRVVGPGCNHVRVFAGI